MYALFQSSSWWLLTKRIHLANCSVLFIAVIIFIFTKTRTPYLTVHHVQFHPIQNEPDQSKRQMNWSLDGAVLQATPEHATRQQRREFQTEVLKSLMDHLLAADALLGEEAALPPSTSSNYSNVVANIFNLTSRIVDKLWQGEWLWYAVVLCRCLCWYQCVNMSVLISVCPYGAPWSSD